MSSRVNFDIFSGSSVPDLARRIAEILDTDIGHIDVSKFSDGEIKVELMENVRGHETFIVQSTSYPANDNMMELILIADALKRSSASKITAVIPYFGYARLDRRVRSARSQLVQK